jgi:excisionase family DNA binding protein
MFLDVHDIATRYGVNEDTVRRWCRTHRLPSVTIGGEYRVSLAKLNEIEGHASGRSGQLLST